MQKSVKEIWEECNAAEAARSPEAFLQEVSFKTRSCYFCGYFNRPRLKAEKDRSFVEDIIYHDLLALPGYDPEPEHRDMIPRLSPQNIWAYACKPCSKKKLEGWN
ncbi:MAG: hypothetical protein EBX40_02860 [Gammaproteobacteria bacterium]|nr:hypothetical protein [Gammaproteobacteria bacterium]